MELKGTVLNVVDFGAFIDIGLKDSGLVHISQMANRYVKSPYDVVAVGDVVNVWVLSVDQERHRVSLTMIQPGTERKPPERRPPPPRRGERGGDRPQGEQGGQPAEGQQAGTGAAPAAAQGQPQRKPPRKQAPRPKLSQAALAGKESLGTFAELAAFWDAKKSEGEQEAAPPPPEGPASG